MMKYALFILVSMICMLAARIYGDSELECRNLRESVRDDTGPVQDHNFTVKPPRVLAATRGSGIGLTCAGSRSGLYVVSVDFGGRQICDWHKIKVDFNKYSVNCSLDEKGILQQTLWIRNAQYELAGTYTMSTSQFADREMATTEVVVLDNKLYCTTNIYPNVPLFAGPACGKPDVTAEVLVINCTISYGGNIEPKITFSKNGIPIDDGDITHYTRHLTGQSSLVYTLRQTVEESMNSDRFTAAVSIDGDIEIRDDQKSASQLTWMSEPVKVAYFKLPSQRHHWVTASKLERGIECHIDTNLPYEVTWVRADDVVVSKTKELQREDVPVDTEFRCVITFHSDKCQRSSEDIESVTVTDHKHAVVGTIVALVLILLVIIVIGLATFWKWNKQGYIKGEEPVVGIAQHEGRIFVMCNQSDKISIKVVNVENLQSVEDERLDLPFVNSLQNGDLSFCKSDSCLYLYGVQKDSETKFIWRLSIQPNPINLHCEDVAEDGFVKGIGIPVKDGTFMCSFVVMERTGVDCIRGSIVNLEDSSELYEEAYLFCTGSGTWLAVKWLDARRQETENAFSVSPGGRVLIPRNSPPCVDVYNFYRNVESVKLSEHFVNIQHVVQMENGRFVVCCGSGEGEHKIYRLEIDGSTVVQEFGEVQGSDLNQLNTPSHLAVDNDGNIYVTDSENFRVMKLSLEGDKVIKEKEESLLSMRYQGKIITKNNAQGDRPVRLAITSEDNEWVCLMVGWTSGKIQRFYIRQQSHRIKLNNLIDCIKYYWKSGKYW